MCIYSCVCIYVFAIVRTIVQTSAHVYLCVGGEGGGRGGGVYVCARAHALKPVLILNSQEFSFSQMWLSLFSL